MTNNQDEISYFPEIKDLSPEGILEGDILIGRLLDGEATSDDRARFERLAELEPGIWRRYARGQEEARRLSAAYDHMMGTAMEVELPDIAAPRPGLRFRQLKSFSGWAAILILGAALTWTVRNGMNSSSPDSSIGQAAGILMSRPVDSEAADLQAYLNQSTVLRQLDPLVLNVEELGDGRLVIQFIRLIEEKVSMDRSLGDVQNDEEFQRLILQDQATPVHSYLEQGTKTGYLLGEREPVILGAHEQPDGTWEIRFIRRLEEVAFVSDLSMSVRGRVANDS